MAYGPVLTAEELLQYGLVCPSAGIRTCDNGGECGLCLQLVPPNLSMHCPYGDTARPQVG